MLSRFVKGQLVAFALISVAGLVFAATQYLDLPKLLGFEQYHVAMELPTANGLYPGAIVTLNGLQVGKVAGVNLRPGGVSVDLAMDDDKAVPADVTATIHSTSAIGEQYVELTPKGASTALLAGGARIPSGGAPPVTAAQLMTSVDALARSVPADKLQTSVNELYQAFHGSSDDLRRLLNSSELLLSSAQANLGPTQQLIENLDPVLRTQQAIGGDIDSFTRDLSSFTGQLAMSDADIRTAIKEGPSFVDQLNTTVNQLHPTLPMLFGDLAATGQVLQVYLPGIRQIVVIYPALVANLESVVLPHADDASGALNFRISVGDPKPCTTGFDTVRRDPSDTSPRTAIPDSYCKVAASDARVVRGARNDPCPNDPARRSATAAGCGLDFGATTTTVTTYDTTTGQFRGPDGLLYYLGGLGTPGKTPASWKSLFLSPLGE